MSMSTAPAVGPASYGDFEALQETFLAVAAEPDAYTKPTDRGFGLFVSIERVFADMDFLAWPVLSISLTGLVKTLQGEQRLRVHYKEVPHNPTTRNAFMVHDYSFVCKERELVEYEHSAHVYPVLPEPRQQITLDGHMDQAEDGRRLLGDAVGRNMEPTTGDCGVLFDRMYTFLQ